MKVMSPTRRKCLAVTSLQTSSLAWPLLPIRFSLYHHLCIHIFSFVYIYILTNYDLGIRSFLLSYCRFYKKKSALLSIFLQIMIWVLCYNFPSLFGWAVLISCWKKKRCKLIIIFFIKLISLGSSYHVISMNLFCCYGLLYLKGMLLASSLFSFSYSLFLTFSGIGFLLHTIVQNLSDWYHLIKILEEIYLWFMALHFKGSSFSSMRKDMDT